MRPYGGFDERQTLDGDVARRLRLHRPPRPPRPPPCAGAGTGAPASVNTVLRPPPCPEVEGAAAVLGEAHWDWARVPCTQSKSDRAASGFTSPKWRRLRVREDVEHLRFGIERAALPVRAAGRVGQHERGERPSHLLTTGGVKIGPIL